MKVLIISDYWNTLNWDCYRGGSESYNMSLWKALLEKGIDAWMLANNDAEFSHPKLKMWDSPTKETFSKLYPGSRFTPGVNFDSILPWIKEGNFDVIITSCSSVRLLRKIASASIPIIHVSHTVVYYRNDPQMFTSFNEIKGSSNFRAITVSKYCMDNINSHVPGYIDNYIHPTYMESPKLDDFSFNKDTIIYTGRVVKTKNVDLLLDCFKGSKYNVIIAGNPQYHSSELKWYNETFLKVLDEYKNIKHYTIMPRKELFELVSKCCCLIVPEATESFSLSAFEAQKLGVPVLHFVNKPNLAVSEFMSPGETGYEVLTYRKRLSSIRESALDLVDKASRMDHKHIYDMFRDKYNTDKFLDNMLKEIEILLGGKSGL